MSLLICYLRRPPLSAALLILASLPSLAVPSPIPECIRAPATFAPLDPIGAHSILAPIDPALAPIACFDLAFPPSLEVQRAVDDAMRPILDRYQLDARWPGAANTPISLTWSFVPDGLSIPSALGDPPGQSELFAQMDLKFSLQGGRATWLAQFQSCFDRWAALTGLSYTRIADEGDDGAAWGLPGAPGLRGDIRIAMKPIDGNGGVLAYNFFPTFGLSPGDMVLDSSEGWNGAAGSYAFMRNVISHEQGHGIGLRHVCPFSNTKLMEPFISTAYNGPQHDDLRSAVRHYGDAYEPNNAPSHATPLAPVSVGSILSPSDTPAPFIANTTLTAISIDTDEDWFRTSVAAPAIATITLRPVGLSYADRPQDGCGGGAGPTTNSAAQADLALQLYDSSGTVLFASAPAAGPGASETLASVLLSPPGNLFLRILATNASSQSQLYALTITGDSAPVIIASDSAFTDGIQLSWTPIAGARYHLYRGLTDQRAVATLLRATPISTASFYDFTAVPGISYFYWVEADTGAGGSRPLAGPDSGTRAPCPADINLSGTISLDDLFDYLKLYLAGDGRADFNHIDGLTIQDVFDFLQAYFTGCA